MVIFTTFLIIFRKFCGLRLVFYNVRNQRFALEKYTNLEGIE